MTDQLPIISGTRAINASAPASTSLLGRGLAAIQSGKLIIPAEIDEEKLVSIFVRLVDAAIRQGHVKFKDNAKFILDLTREKFGSAAANMITIGYLQGAYISLIIRYKDLDVDDKHAVIKIDSLEKLYFDVDQSQSLHPQESSCDKIQNNFYQEICKAKDFDGTDSADTVNSMPDEDVKSIVQGIGCNFKPELAFDEETYEKAKPLFLDAIKHLDDAAKDIKENMRTVIDMVIDRSGLDVAIKMKPYIVKFILHHKVKTTGFQPVSFSW